MRAAVVAIGFVSMLVQLTLLREFLNLFHGNELVFGLILSLWLVLVGAGSYIAGRVRFRDKEGAFTLTLVAASVLLPVTVYLARTAGAHLTIRGEMAGLPQIILAAAATLTGYCLLYGVQITLACSILADEERGRGVGFGYMLDSAGDVLGGVTFSFILVTLFNSFQVAYVAAAVNLTAAWMLSGRLRAAVAVLTVALIVLAASTDLQAATNRLQYEGQELLEQRDTRYGNIVVTRMGGQTNFYENSVPLFSTENVVAAEETVHYAMVQRDAPRKVLLVAGGVSGTLSEILKYDVGRVDYVELDPAIVELAREYLDGTSLDDPRVNVVNADGRLYVKTTQEVYDVVIIDLPDPTTAQLNRFYTIEFFREVDGVLAEHGVLSTSMSSSENYMNEEVLRLNAGLYSTLSAVFDEVAALPGGRNIFMASDSALSTDIAGLVEERGVPTEYVNKHYLSGIHTRDRLEYLSEAVASGGQVNWDYKPIGYLEHLRYWMSHFNLDFDLRVAAAVLVLASAVAYLALKPVPASVLAAGFTGTALELVLLISFQALYGYVYHQVGVLVTSFMVGLVAAAYYVNTRLKKTRGEFRLAVAGLSVYPLILAACMTAFNTHPGLTQASSSIIFPALTAALGALVGALFPVAASLVQEGRSAQETAGFLYGLDFMGAFFGSMLVAVFLIPYAGLINVCAITCVFNALSWWRLRCD
jgi:spermidine synthase